jgi:signal transduction histidine kinase
MFFMRSVLPRILVVLKQQLYFQPTTPKDRRRERGIPIPSLPYGQRGHELNNSLTPIKSIAGSLESTVAREPLPGDWRDDMRRGLSVIMSRSDSLSRFIGAYARLAKLPRPQLQPLSVADCVGRAVSFETRLPVRVDSGPGLTIQGDPDQLEQVLINLLRNVVRGR